MSNSKRSLQTLLSLASLAAGAPGAFAGGTPEYAIVIIDPSNEASLRVGNYYVQRRNIPPSNVFYIKSSASSYAEFVNTVQKAVQSTIDQRGLADHADYIVIAPLDTFFVPAGGLVSDTCFPVNRFSISSCYTMSFISSEVLAHTSSSLANGYFANTDGAAYFDSNNRYQNGAISTGGLARRYYIGALLGWTGSLGNSPDQIIALIDRSAAVDGTRPAGSFYFMNNAADGARNVREIDYLATAGSIITRGGTAAELSGVLPANRTNCLGIMSGAAYLDFVNTTVGILPGAFCDHLTSYAGTFDIPDQTKLTDWLARGASGSAGTVEEPCNFLYKFPHPRLHLWYYQGLSLGESYLRSMAAVPFQSLLVGDPLTRPFSYIPSVTAPGLPAPSTPFVGSLAFTPDATTANPAFNTLTMEVYIDGVWRGTLPRATPFTFNTANLDDGWHDLRIIARDSTAVRNTGRLATSLTTANNGRSAATSVFPALGEVDQPFDFTTTASGGAVREVRLLQNERVVAAGAAGQPLRVYGSQLGPGVSRVRADVVFTDGRIARAAPVSVTVGITTPHAAAVAPTAYSYTKPAFTPSSTYIVELPAAFDGDPALATYSIVSPPQGVTVTGSGPYRLVTTPASFTSASTAMTFRVQTAAGQSGLGTVTLQFTPQAPCTADFNNDGTLNPDDLADFIGCYFTVPPCPQGDYNGDSVINPDDLADYIGAFFAGC